MIAHDLSAQWGLVNSCISQEKNSWYHNLNSIDNIHIVMGSLFPENS